MFIFFHSFIDWKLDLILILSITNYLSSQWFTI